LVTVDLLASKAQASIGSSRVGLDLRLQSGRCCGACWYSNCGGLSLPLPSEINGRLELSGGPFVDGDLGLRGWDAGVYCPAGTPVGQPVPGQVFDGLVEVVGDQVDGGVRAGPAGGDVGELSSAAVGEVVAGVGRQSLTTMDREGVGIRESAGAEVVSGEFVRDAVVHPDGCCPGLVVDGDDLASLACHQFSAC
jgi:hypothetical protein